VAVAVRSAAEALMEAVAGGENNDWRKKKVEGGRRGLWYRAFLLKGISPLGQANLVEKRYLLCGFRVESFHALGLDIHMLADVSI
jgi:hypothetical protein